MKVELMVVAGVCGLTVSACNRSPSDKLADRVEDAADARADAIENRAETNLAKAEDIRETGEQRADAIDAANRDDANMTQGHRNAIVANEAPAVR